MNKDQRKRLEKAIDLLSEAQVILRDIQEQEDEKYNNMPDGLSSSYMAMTLCDNSNDLEEVESDINEVVEKINQCIER